MPMFTHKPTRVEAVQFKGGERNAAEVIAWLISKNAITAEWFRPRSVEGLSGDIAMSEEMHIQVGNSFAIASPGDWIVQDQNGKLHRFTHKEFERNYVAS